MASSLGEKSLANILSGLRAAKTEGRFLFCKVRVSTPGFTEEVRKLHDKGVEPIGLFSEKEGLTVIINTSDLSLVSDMDGFEHNPASFSRLTLEVHSSLEAVGLTAAVSAKLTECNISANVVAAYFHDHIFVQESEADAAVAAINSLGPSGQNSS